MTNEKRNELRNELQTRLDALDELARLERRTAREVVIHFEDGSYDTFDLKATARALVADLVAEEARRLEAAALGVDRVVEEPGEFQVGEWVYQGQHRALVLPNRPEDPPHEGFTFVWYPHLQKGKLSPTSLLRRTLEQESG